MHFGYHVKRRYSCPVFTKFEISRQIFEKILKNQIFMKISPVEAELFHADGQTDGHDEANSRFSKFCERP